MLVEIGLFPLVCGWWLDICSLVSTSRSGVIAVPYVVRLLAYCRFKSIVVRLLAYCRFKSIVVRLLAYCRFNPFNPKLKK